MVLCNDCGRIFRPKDFTRRMSGTYPFIVGCPCGNKTQARFRDTVISAAMANKVNRDVEARRPFNEEKLS